MSAARLRHRITLQQPTVTRDAAGAVQTAWTDLPEVWAECLPLAGRELLAVQGKGSKASWRILIRWRADVDTRHRVRYGARILNITDAADRTGQRRWLWIEAEEIHVD